MLLNDLLFHKKFPPASSGNSSENLLSISNPVTLKHRGSLPLTLQASALLAKTQGKDANTHTEYSPLISTSFKKPLSIHMSLLTLNKILKGNSMGFLQRYTEVSSIGFQIVPLDRTFYADHFEHQKVYY